MARSCDPFRQNHKRYIIENLLDEYGDVSNENFFLSIGKITPWATEGDTRTASTDSVKDNTDYWRGMIAAKRINRNDVSLVVPRIDWVPGVAYQPYRDNIDLHDDLQPANFYALVDDERVYVCIDNNYGSPSLYAPIHTDSVVRKLADGYRWKFLYQIPESKRKFLTKTAGGNIGYMPVEYVKSLRTNDDRNLQWLVQQAAGNGKIEFAFVDAPAKVFWITTQAVVIADNANEVISTVPSGATSAVIYAPTLVPSDIYSNMMFTIESGPGQGQRRIIKSYVWQGNNAKIEFDALVNGLSGGEAIPPAPSRWSITPRVIVSGDGVGSGGVNALLNSADFTLKFGQTADLTGDVCAVYAPRLVSSVEVIDGGKEYTYANLSVVKGLTSLPGTPAEYKDFSTLIHAVMPPAGGHGSNAVNELGANAYMIVKDFTQDENGKVDVNNDFRQIGVLRNPLLAERRVRLKFYQPGLSGSFAVGLTAGYGTGPYGTVLEWCNGFTGTTATSELVLGNIRGGTFAAGATVGSLTVFDALPIEYAGQEARHLLDLTLATAKEVFAADGSDYNRNYFAHGLGNQGMNVPQSRSSGQVYRWTPSPATNKFGTLSLEFPKGDFRINELVGQTDPLFNTTNGYSGPGRITAIDTSIVGLPSVYDLTTTLTITGSSFEADTFIADSYVNFGSGLTTANGYIIDWTPVTGGTSGVLRLAGVRGSIVAGQSVDYVTSANGLTFSVLASVQGVSHSGEFKYASGDVLYIQNINPVSRDLEQREEVKLVIEL